LPQKAVVPNDYQNNSQWPHTHSTASMEVENYNKYHTFAMLTENEKKEHVKD